MIECLSVQYPVKDCCLALDAPRSGYYRWKKAPPSARAREERALGQELEKLFKDNRGRYGSPRMTKALREKGYKLGKNRVARLMRERKLAARKKRAFRPKTTRSVEVAVPNQIADLEALAPDQIWVSDITYVATAEGWLYLAIILDLFSRRVVGWKLSESLDASLVCTALQNALVLRQPAKGLYFHSDRGSQYASHAIQKILQAIQAQPSMSGVGNCYDNAKAEAFFSTLKTECFPVNNVFGSKAEARNAIFEYIEIYYNNQRFHSALDYQSPRQFETHYLTRKRNDPSLVKQPKIS
jgi:transposase InsO family protein